MVDITKVRFMKFETLFEDRKPLIGMIHIDGTDEDTTLELAKKE